MLAAIIAPLLAACAPDPTHPAPNPTVEPPKLIGRVASVPPGKRFVLIQSFQPRHIPTGTILTTRGPHERTANLLATGESLGAFTAADIQSGNVETGDAVYTRHVPQPPEPEPAPPDSEPPPRAAGNPEPAGVPTPELPRN